MNLKNIQHRIYWNILALSRGSKIVRPVIDIAAFFYYCIFRFRKQFVFNNYTYTYFYHLHNRTFGGERAIEIPIALKYLFETKGKNTLEVGDVLSHYVSINHDILDKYEKRKGIINEDVASVSLGKKYDLILSISTMEHVGHSYGEKLDPNKFLKGIKNLKRHLTKNGTLVITVPVYYNPFLTELIIAKKIPFTTVFFMKRISYMNDWKQIDYAEAIKGNTYDGYFANTNVLCICVYNNILK